MDYIIRNRSVITGKKNLENLYTFKNFPVFFGCTDQNESRDVRADMSWAICPESGVIQLDKLIPLEILYQEQHMDGTGPFWEQYYYDFTAYIIKQNVENILEIGGGAGKLASIATNAAKDIIWTIVEPNPLKFSNKRVRVIPAFFDENFSSNEPFDSVVFSQVLEHAYDPNIFLSSIARFLKIGGKLIFAYPNIKLLLERKFTNAINFEHTIFLTDYFIDCLLKKYGFGILDKNFYKDHSIFYVVKKIKNTEEKMNFENKYQEYKKIFNEFIRYHQDLVIDLNNKMENFSGEIYLFGAHIFAQYLFEFGLNKKKIVCILDNSKLKQNRRLYGTNFITRNPEFIRNKKNVAVVLRVGLYRDEIAEQLLEINPDITFLE